VIKPLTIKVIAEPLMVVMVTPAVTAKEAAHNLYASI